MASKKRITIGDIADSDECPCSLCSSQDVHKYFTEEEHAELENLPPISKEEEENMRRLAKLLIRRVFEEIKSDKIKK